MLELTSHTYVDGVPDQIRMLDWTTRGITIVAISYQSYSNVHHNGASVGPIFPQDGRITVIEWKDPADKSTFIVSHIDLLGQSGANGKAVQVQSHALVRTADGENIYLIAQYMTESNEPTTVVYRRFENEGMKSENEESEDESTGFQRVQYQRLPHIIDVKGKCWTWATALNPIENALVWEGNTDGPTSQKHMSNVILVAATKRPPLAISSSNSASKAGLNPSDVASLQYIKLETRTRASVEKTVELPLFNTFPIQCIQPLYGGASSDNMLALSHHAIVLIKGKERDVSMEKAWVWTSHDPLTCFCVKDNFLFAGSDEGVVVQWDLWHSEKSSAALHHSAPTGSSIVSIYAPPPSYSTETDFVTCHTDGSMLAWTEDKSDSYGSSSRAFRYIPRRVEGFSPACMGLPSAVSMAGCGNRCVVAEECGAINIFTIL